MKIECPDKSCGHSSEVSDDLATQPVACPKCGCIIRNTEEVGKAGFAEISGVQNRAAQLFLGGFCVLILFFIGLAWFALIKSLIDMEYRSFDMLSAEQICSFVFLPLVTGVICFAVVNIRFKALGLSFGTTGPNAESRVGDRNSNTIEERVSGWVTLIAESLGAFGGLLGLPVFVYLVADLHNYYGSDSKLIIASVVLVVGMLIIAIVRKAVGCLSTVFIFLAVAGVVSYLGLKVDSQMEVGLVLLLCGACLVGGNLLFAALGVILGTGCAMGPMLVGRKFVTAKAKPYNFFLGLLHSVVLLFAAPIIAVAIAFKRDPKAPESTKKDELAEEKEP